MSAAGSVKGEEDRADGNGISAVWFCPVATWESVNFNWAEIFVSNLKGQDSNLKMYEVMSSCYRKLHKCFEVTVGLLN